MNASTTLGSLIASARKQLKISQVNLSALCGFPYNAASKWENGQSKPTVADWERLRELLRPALDEAAAAPLLERSLAEGAVKQRGAVPRVDADINRRLRLLRERSGMTMVEVGEVLDRNASHISRIESNDANPTLDQLRKLAKLYGVTYDYLLDGTTGTTEPYHEVVMQRNFLRKVLHAILSDGVGKAVVARHVTGKLARSLEVALSTHGLEAALS